MKFPNHSISIHINPLLFLLLVFLSSSTLVAQQDAQYTQYMYNTASVNPGYAGSRGHLSIAALHRSQWVGLEGAPVTQTVNLHSPVGYRGVGLGLSIVNDKIGPTSETYADIDFSYTLQLSVEAKLSFGLKASAHLLDVRFSELNQIAPDNTLSQDIDNKFSPNFGAGVYYHNERFYAGLSVPRFLETTHFQSGSSPSTAAERMNFYFITGYVWEFNPFLKFKPTLLTKVVQGAPLQVDVSANFLLSDKFVVGAAYRWDAAFSGMAGFYISESIFAGVAYDREVTELGNAAFNDGSFEVILRYDFIRTKGQLKSPRFF
ncbi:type IX secretion system membrane protein PorP/SprF [Aggregatimonas sangjinii]|uniref:Type IX secretion system membrane protein PorP/SprF n=1 Tax=Aggregatimonas sangjinii TaxID=2583587 RepID=A0A5B7SL26_9FLAO|nr:type IX secretion system membrane protein PorP/SprF [Aggregatimonas sangjinii]QCW99244.1 type IX secretion system membrane protein PorP/SprF [Aggregatimonas sangjinii]